MAGQAEWIENKKGELIIQFPLLLNQYVDWLKHTMQFVFQHLAHLYELERLGQNQRLQ